MGIKKVDTIWVDGHARPLGQRDRSPARAHDALRRRRVRRHPRVPARRWPHRRSSGCASTSSACSTRARSARWTCPYTRDQLMQACVDVVRVEQDDVVLPAPARLPRLRRARPRLARAAGSHDGRLLRVGRVPRRRRPQEGHQVHDLRLHARERQRGDEQGQDLRPVRDVGAREAHGDQERLRRGAHARPAGLRRRGHGREHLRRQERHRAHAADRPPRSSPASRATPRSRCSASRASRSARRRSRATSSTSPTKCS